ncbi:hypothetical protein GF374_03505 [Candidatus Woesearchaeota archaeon]|nr:hypothetical protein [Candidatus Woesearchaeota archaeon]
MTDFDMARSLSSDEHTLRSMHNGKRAKIVEAEGDEVSSYNIVFEDSYEINGLAASELKAITEGVHELIKDPSLAGSEVETPMMSTAIYKHTIKDVPIYFDGAQYWAVRNGRIYEVSPEGVEESKNSIISEKNWWKELLDSLKEDKKFNSLVSKHGARSTEVLEYFKNNYWSDSSSSDAAKVALEDAMKELGESKTNEAYAEKVPQTMQPQEKPDIDAENYGMEDYSDEELNKPETKVKSKSEETGNAIRKVEDDEVHDQAPEPKKKVKKESKTNEGEESEVISPSRAELKKLSDDVLRSKQIDASEAFDYWKGRGVEEFAVKASKALNMVEDEMHKRGILSHVEDRLGKRAKKTEPKKESKFKFSKQKPLWLCNECFKTFRSDKGICESCESKNTEKLIKEQDVPFYKEVYEVSFEDKDGNPGSIRVEAHDETDAEKVANKAKGDVIGKITDVKLIKESTQAAPGNKESKRKTNEYYQEEDVGDYEVTFYDGHKEVIKGAKSRVHAMDAARQRYKDEQRVVQAKKVSESITEGVEELIGEVPGISKDDQIILRWAMQKEIIPSEWPDEDEIIDELSKVDVPKEDKWSDWDNKALYVKFVLLPKAEAARATKESKVNEEENWDLTFKYQHNQLGSNPLVDREGNLWRHERRPITGRKVRVFSDYQAGWVKGKGAIPVVKVEANEKLTPEEVKNIHAPTIRFHYGTSEKHSKVMGDLAKTDFFKKRMVGTKVKLIDASDHPEEFAKDDDKQWKPWTPFGFVEESNLKEQSFKTVAKGIADRDNADELARRENGMVIEDPDAEDKFAVIVKEE